MFVVSFCYLPKDIQKATACGIEGLPLTPKQGVPNLGVGVFHIYYKMIKRTCLVCGNKFYVPNYRKNSAIFCSRECKYAFGRTNKKCLFCSKSFESVKWLNKEYCSRRCADEAKKKRVIKICKICGEEYEVQTYRVKTSKYCSIKCRNEGVSKNLAFRAKGKKNPNYKGKINKICKHCKKKFKVHPYRLITANYCSIKCSKLDTSEKTRKQIAESIKKLQRENPKIHPNYILAQKGHVTKIEKLIRDELIRRKLAFEIQYRILGYWVDFAFPAIKLAVECDGERWHSTEEQIFRDAKKDERLKNIGWAILRFKGKEILDNTKEVVDKIEEYYDKNNR